MEREMDRFKSQADRQTETNDEAMAKALQEEYDRENRELRHNQSQPRQYSSSTYDYRTAGYQNSNAVPQPAVCQVACSTCGHVNQVPFTSGVVDFRCSNCAFVNSYAPPRANGGCRDVHLMPVPIFCNIM